MDEKIKINDEKMKNCDNTFIHCATFKKIMKAYHFLKCFSLGNEAKVFKKNMISNFLFPNKLGSSQTTYQRFIIQQPLSTHKFVRT